jgi:hypothetical protein
VFCLCEIYTARAVRKSWERFCLFGGQKEKKAGSFALVQRQFFFGLFRPARSPINLFSEQAIYHDVRPRAGAAERGGSRLL